MAVVGGVVLLGLFTASAAAEEAAPGDLFESLEEIDKLTLADLLQAETNVASLTRHSQRSSPGILSIITREEIRASGARDLIDVLRRVPGFAFGTDVQGVIGIGFRGLWGHEGKVLLLLDGHEMNEGMYLTTQFGAHLPVDQIEKIEIIRGPGSAIYGGYAELAVINVVTRRGNELNGPAATVSYGHTEGGFARRTVSLAYGKTFDELGGLKLSASGYLGQTRLSGLTYSDFGGASFSMRDNSGAEPAYLNLNAAWRGLELSFVYDGYKVLDRTGLVESLGKPVRLGFPGYYLGARYELELGSDLTLTSKVRYKHQSPWRMVDSDPLARELAYYNKTFERLDASLALAWRPLDGLDVAGGVQGQLDWAAAHGDYVGLNGPFADGAREVSYRNLALFLQGDWRNSIVNVTAGARYERHSAVGGSFVPRLGLTRQIGDLHLKALWSNAFKAPGVENISLNPDIRPERTRVFELEAGYLFGESLYAAVNLFDMAIAGPIVYDIDQATGEEGYVNYNNTAISGAEAILRYEHPRASATLAYAYYHAHDNEVPVYAVPGESATFIGFARHKLAASGRLEPLRRLFIAPSLVFLSGRHGYVAGSDSARQLEQVEPTWLVDLFVSYRPATFEGLELGAGVYNLLGQRFLYLQPYDGGHAPIPGMGREIALRVAYEH
jgi:outer membrane receptor for ferrienterochelin and colicin